MSTEPMTDEEYVGANGVLCPFCRSDNLRGDDITIEGGSCSQEIWCEDCGKGWWDAYELKGYVILN